MTEKYVKTHNLKYVKFMSKIFIISQMLKQLHFLHFRFFLLYNPRQTWNE